MRVISEQSLQWRRDKTRELTIKGHTQRDIAAELKISATIVNRDLQSMRAESKENIKHYVDEYLPAEYQHCLDALNMIVKEMWALKTDDNRELIQSRALIKECCSMRIELLSNASVVDRAVKFVENHANANRTLPQAEQNSKVAIDNDSTEP